MKTNAQAHKMPRGAAILYPNPNKKRSDPARYVGGYVAMKGDPRDEFIHRHGGKISKRFYSAVERVNLGNKSAMLIRWSNTVHAGCRRAYAARVTARGNGRIARWF